MIMQVSKRSSVPAAAGPAQDGSRPASHLVTKSPPAIRNATPDEENLGRPKIRFGGDTRLETLSEGTFAIIVTLKELVQSLVFLSPLRD